VTRVEKYAFLRLGDLQGGQFSKGGCSAGRREYNESRKGGKEEKTILSRLLSTEMGKNARLKVERNGVGKWGGGGARKRAWGLC